MGPRTLYHCTYSGGYGDLAEWPLHPHAVRSVVRVHFVRGSEKMIDKFRDLYVRSKVVKKLASIYIDRKVQDLAGRKGVMDIHKFEQCESVGASLKAHAERRVDTFYPPNDHDTAEGGLLPGVRELVREQLDAGIFFSAGTPHTPIFPMAHNSLHGFRAVFPVFERIPLLRCAMLR